MKKSNERIRQEYLCDVLNAAVNLYGVVEYDAVIRMCERYAKGKTGPLATPPTAEEIDAMIGWDEKTGEVVPAVADSLGRARVFVGYEMKGVSLLVHEDMLDDCFGDDDFLDDEKAGKVVLDFVVNLAAPSLMILSRESDFLAYADCYSYVQTEESERLLRYLHEEYDFSEEDADDAVCQLVYELRKNPDPNHALIFTCAANCLVLDDAEDYDDLMNVILPLSRNVRVWRYGGRTDAEMIEDGISDKFHAQIDQSVRRNFLRKAVGKSIHEFLDEKFGFGDADGYMDVDEPELLSDDELEKALPSPDYPQHPVDFKFVKDAKKREAALRDYRLLREETQRFVRDVMMPKLTPEARKAAAKRLGFVSSDDVAFLIGTLDMVAGDFGSMLDDQDGEPLRRQVLADVSKLSKRDQLMARYYANYRYSWLVVEAAKAGVGVKCRNLMTGEELFLMEINLSQAPDVKGLTICAGIAPMGDVYLSLGTPHIARFEPSETVHKLVRQKLGLPLEGRLDLSDADQARFAAETIHRIYDVGGFNRIVYGR